MHSIGSHILTFLLGIAVGAGGAYFADKYTDRRRERETRSAARKRFKQLVAVMPTFIAELKEDLAEPDASAVREFFVLPTPGVMLGGSDKRRFRYNESQHESLKEHLDLLVDSGFLNDVTMRNAPIFRMTEQFVELVRAHKLVA